MSGPGRATPRQFSTGERGGQSEGGSSSDPNDLRALLFDILKTPSGHARNAHPEAPPEKPDLAPMNATGLGTVQVISRQAGDDGTMGG